jgi:hypothetical protein
MIICYLTNPIVCLFATELGELEGFLNYWATWDDSLDPAFFVKTRVPSFLRYDWDKHYEEFEDTTPELDHVGRKRWFTKFKEGGHIFTTKERIQRYFCRVLWLTRNCGYGFAFWMFGKEVLSSNMVWVKNEKDVRYGYDISENILTRAWMYKAHIHLFWRIYFDAFLGWKINDEPSTKPCQAMIANRVVLSID